MLERQSEAPDNQAVVVLFSDMDAHLPGLIQPGAAKKIWNRHENAAVPHATFFMFLMECRHLFQVFEKMVGAAGIEPATPPV